MNWHCRILKGIFGISIKVLPNCVGQSQCHKSRSCTAFFQEEHIYSFCFIFVPLIRDIEHQLTIYDTVVNAYAFRQFVGLNSIRQFLKTTLRETPLAHLMLMLCMSIIPVSIDVCRLPICIEKRSGKCKPEQKISLS